MSDVPLSHEESIVVDATPEAVYDLVSDITRTGEWSPICQACWWDDPATAGEVGSHFTGRNVLPDRTWETRSEVVAAERGREFAWHVAGGWVRWGYTLAPAAVGTGTALTETWNFLPAGIAGFHEKYADTADAEIAARSQAALSGIPATLAAIKRIAEATRVLSDTDLPAPVEDRWFEDYVPGSVHEFGHVSVTEDEIVAFATSYDPQRIHTDPAWAATGPFGGLIASGMQTMAVTMRLYVDHYISRVASLASPGLDEVRFTRPVRPGDTLRIRVTIDSARLSRSKPDRGLVHTSVEILNQDDEVALSFKAMNFLARRPD